METLLSEASKVQLEDYIRIEGLSQEMLDAMFDYLLTLRVSEGSKAHYLQKLRKFGLWLMKQGIRNITSVKKSHIDRFLATYNKNNTKNSIITALKPFYRDFLNKPSIVEDLGYYAEELEPITPSDVLTPDEIVRIAEQCYTKEENVP